MPTSDDAPQSGPFAVPPPPPGAPDFSQLSPSGPPVAATASGYSPYAYAPRWRRRWNTTFVRWSIGAGTVLGLAVSIAILFSIRSADLYSMGYIFGTVMTGPVLYCLFVAWWLDHVIASTGKWGSFAIHGSASLFAALFFMTSMSYSSTAAPSVASTVPLGVNLLLWAVGFPLANLFASMIKKSFPPKASKPTIPAS